MKKIIVILVSVILSSAAADGQNCNPFVSQGNISPSILYDVASNGTGQFSFMVGNNGVDPLPLEANREMLLTVSISRGEPDNINPIAAIGGSYANYFNWLYDAASKTYQGTQNQTIPSGGYGDITIGYKVSSNSIMASPQNGFNVNITPPPFTNGVNALIDDQLSLYSWTVLKPLPFVDLGSAASTVKNSENTNGVENNILEIDDQANGTNDPGNPYDVTKVANDVESVTVYPNPAVNYLNIKINALVQDQYDIKITDNEGRTMLKTASVIGQGTKTIRVSTSNMAAGIYTVIIASKSKTYTSKVTIEK